MSDDEDLLRREAEARVGETLRGKWTLESVLGVGGMASVFAATHRNGKRGAVKLLHRALGRSSEARARFLREGYVANTVAHRGTVSVLDDDVTDDDGVFLVMELLEGSTVDAVADTRPNRIVSVPEVLAIADELLDVLAAAHDKGIVHRDIKPENLFLTHEGALKVLDFGIARLRQGSESMTSTRAGESMGTPAFMPPEQALGDWDAVDGRTDIWAAGATMFTLLTGRFVHDAENVQKMMLAAMTRPAPAIRTLEPSVPEDVAALIDRSLAQKREDRFADAAAMQAAVRAAIKALPEDAPRPAPAGSTPRSQSPSHALFRVMSTRAASAATYHGVAGADAAKMTAAPVSTLAQAADRKPRKWIGFAMAGAAIALIATGLTIRSLSSKPSAPQTSATAAASAVESSALAPTSSAVVTVVSAHETTTAPAAVSSASSATAEAATASVARLPSTARPRPSTASPKPTPTSAPTTFNGRF